MTKSHYGTPRHILQIVVRFLLITISTLILASVHYVFLNILRIFLAYRPRVYDQIESYFFRWIQYPIALWLETANYYIYDIGEDVTPYIDKECIVMVNHQTTADVPCLITNLQAKGHALRNIMWILDILFKWSPFGWPCQIHKDYFITQGRSTRANQLLALHQHLDEVYVNLDRKWIIVFPEGGFLYKRRQTSQEYARKNGYPHVEHVTLPRVGAIEVGLQALTRKTTAPSPVSTVSGGCVTSNSDKAPSCTPESSGDAQHRSELGDISADSVKKRNLLKHFHEDNNSAVKKEPELSDAPLPNNQQSIRKSSTAKGHFIIADEPSSSVSHPVTNWVAKLTRPTAAQLAKHQAFYETLEERRARKNLKYIIDVTIAYETFTEPSTTTANGQANAAPTPPQKSVVKPLDLMDILTGRRPPCGTHFFWRVYPVSGIPMDSQFELQSWLYDRWVEKDARLEYFYEHGVLPWLDAKELESVPPRDRILEPRRVSVCLEQGALIYAIYSILAVCVYYYIPCFMYRLFVA